MRVDDLPVPESPNGREVLVPLTRSQWRAWLGDRSDRTEGIWVVYAKKSSGLDGPDYVDLVEEALCHGWIDSVTRRVDEDRVIQWFSPRRSGGIWSMLNKERIERLERDGLMTAAGRAMIDRAKADGSWSQYDEVEALVLPPDLAEALDAEQARRAAYEALSDSAKKQILWALYSAKRPETRARRLADVIDGLS